LAGILIALEAHADSGSTKKGPRKLRP